MGYDEFDGFGDYEEQGSQGLKEVRAAYKALKKQFDDQAAALATATGQLAQRSLKDVLAEKGLRPGLARVIAKEDVDLTDSKAVDAWLSDPANQEDFGFSLEAAPAAEGAPAGDAGGHEEYAANLAAIQGASNGAIPDAKYEQARSAIKGAETPEALQAALDAAIKQAS